MTLDTIFTASLLDALPQPLCVRNNYVAFTGFFLVWVPTSSWILLSSWLLKILLSTLSMAHLGYLNLVSALLRYCNSLVRSSGQVQTTLALWVSVLTTLYLAARLWWLSHCKYWSVCMGFLYTVLRKGIVPFSWLPSTVNLIVGSILLIWSRKFCFWSSLWITNVSSIYLIQNLGGWRL